MTGQHFEGWDSGRTTALLSPYKDKRLSLALKYYDSDLLDEAWAVLRELIDELEPPSEALHLAVTLRLEVGAFDEV